MKKNILILCFLTLTFLGYSQTYIGTIIRVIDGDTYVFQTKDGSFVVIIQGRDAPERDQPFCKESTEFLSKYLNRDVIAKVYVKNYLKVSTKS